MLNGWIWWQVLAFHCIQGVLVPMDFSLLAEFLKGTRAHRHLPSAEGKGGRSACAESSWTFVARGCF